MTREQLLLTKIAEECAEVAQRALKAQQFGMNEIQDCGQENPQNLNNAERLAGELDDLWAVVKMLQHGNGMLRDPNPLRQGLKMHKVEKWLAYAQKLGQVAGEREGEGS